MRVLGIESSCDETAASIVDDGKVILSNIVSSQSALHAPYGGVIPELACRRHVEVIIPVINQALSVANTKLSDIDLIAAAKGPGLIGALLIGLNAAKALSFAMDIPFIGINHLEAHLYAAMMDHLDHIPFPALGLILSGGHTALVHIDNLGSYRVIGITVDDAIGEAFDKVASMLNLPYPGGRYIEELAKTGDPYKYSFSAGKCKRNPLNFSYSGLKTNVLYAVKGQNSHKNSPLIIDESEKQHIAASFQRAAFSDILNKTLTALDQHMYRSIILGGGVCCNQNLNAMFTEAITTLPIFWPKPNLSCDNAAMIAGLAYHKFRDSKKADSFDLKVMPRIPALI